MPSPAEKLSVSVPAELAGIVRKRVGPRGLSGFVVRALLHELEREQLGKYLGELDAQLRAVPASELRAARRAWARR